MNAMAIILLQQGLTAYQSSNPTQAKNLFQAVLKLDPINFDALHLLGVLAADHGAHSEAIRWIQQAQSINPHVAAAHANLASSLRQLKRYDEALTSLDRALALDPQCAEAMNTRGNILRTLGQLDSALHSLDQAIALQPSFVEAHDNRGNVLRDMCRLDEALASYTKAREISPGYASAWWNESLCRLLKGDFKNGWPMYEAGWSIGLRTPRVDAQQPRWTGAEPLQDRTILLHAEQGFGDTLQFCRYAQHLSTHYGARVILEVQPELQGLLTDMPGVAAVLARGQNRPHFDFHSPLLSLPLACNTQRDSIPPPAALALDKTRNLQWQERLAPHQSLRIGLVWSGSQTLENDRNRSIPLQTLSPLIAISPGTFFSLQKEVRASDKDALANTPSLQHDATSLQDFADTAALISQMDLVITVDSAVAHLAATLGKPTWLLLPRVPDWRWLMDRGDSLWYPSIRLFRQQEAGNWTDLIEKQLHPALADFVEHPKT